MKANTRQQRRNEYGIVLVSTLFFIMVLLSMVGAHFILTNIELATTRSTSNSARGFAAAEAGLNLRAEEIRTTFLDYNRPTGTSPATSAACSGANMGSGDFACQNYTLGTHTVTTYIIESPDNPIITTIPPGELYQNLNAQEYRYTVRSVSRNSQNRVEAILELRFKSRLVPLFQFVAFYNKDLEILPGPAMDLSGPIHTNGDLYLNANNSLRVAGQVTTAGRLFRGRKNDSSCMSRPVQVMDPSTYRSVVPSCGSRTEVLEADTPPWNGMIQLGVDEVVVPGPEILDPGAGNAYWDKADIRLVLHLNGSNNPDLSNSATGVEIRMPVGTTNTAATTQLDACSGQIDGSRAVGYSNTFYNNREGMSINMLEVDLEALFDCVQTTLSTAAPIMGGRGLDDDTQGGLVFHFSVDGPDSAASSNSYGVRIRNANELASTVGGAPEILGLTMVTDQAFYSHGHYNRTNKKPSAFLGDSFNVLSRRWDLDDADSHDGNVNNRPTYNTTINAAILAGTDTTGNVEGVAGQSLGNYSGGLENYPRFHESWSGKTLSYRGSFVSLNLGRHVDGAWVYGNPQYKAPNRDWDYDTDFNDAANLPPMSPRFVYLRQELFVRDYEQE